MPLIRYLAHYQSIEHHYPRFYERDLTARIRNHLRDPRFDFDSDSMIHRIISTASRGRKGAANELDLLKATLTGSIDGSDLVEFLQQRTDLAAFLEKGKLDGVPNVKLPQGSRERDAASLTDQIADRIYAIRCRIVHAKDDADKYTEPLLPYSADAAQLRLDLELLEFICQRVIIAGGASRQGDA